MIDAHRVRALAASWAVELRALGARPRLRRGRRQREFLDRSRPWTEREAAIASAIELAQDLEDLARQRAAATVVAGRQDLAGKVVALRAAGLTFAAAAKALGIPVGTAKTLARRVRLGGAA